VRLRRTVKRTTRLHHQPPRHRSQSREDLCHHQHESSHVHQRRAEANRVHGGSEQIYLEAWRMGVPILQTTQTSREVRVDSRGRPSCCSTSLRLLTWLVLPSLLSGRKTATPTQSSAQSTSSARSYQNPRHAASQYRSFCTQCSSPCGSYDTTSRSTRSPSSPSTRSATSCGTMMLLEEYPSGQSNSAPSTSTSSHTQPSSRRR
jgi:hypothetical protein